MRQTIENIAHFSGRCRQSYGLVSKSYRGLKAHPDTAWDGVDRASAGPGHQREKRGCAGSASQRVGAADVGPSALRPHPQGPPPAAPRPRQETSSPSPPFSASSSTASSKIPTSPLPANTIAPKRWCAHPRPTASVVALRLGVRWLATAFARRTRFRPPPPAASPTIAVVRKRQLRRRKTSRRTNGPWVVASRRMSPVHRSPGRPVSRP